MTTPTHPSPKPPTTPADRTALNAPEPLLSDSPKYLAITSSSPGLEAITTDDKELSPPTAHHSNPRRPQHASGICGLRPRTFHALLALLLLALTGAAIGAGVGGRLSAHATTAPTTTTVTTTTTTHSAASPTNTTTNSTTTFYLSLYALPSFAGAAHPISTPGNSTLPWQARSYVWDQQSSDCCVVFCRDGGSVGWRCGEATYQTEVGGVGAGGVVDGVGVRCGAGGGVEPPPGGWCGVTAT